jgi:uncharacterized protein (DUF1697 family)
MDVRCLIRNRDELRLVIAQNPLDDLATEGSKLMALFLSDALKVPLLSIHNPKDLAPEQIHLGDRVIYQWCPAGLLEAPDVSGFVIKHFNATVTMRNWNTVARLGSLLDDLDPRPAP